MRFEDAATVTLQDIGKVLKMSAAAVAAECSATNIYVGRDWAGRSAVTVDDERRLVSGAARRERDADVTNAARARATEQWEAARSAAYSRAQQAAWDDGRRRGLPDPESYEAARVAARVAAETFERSHPQPADGASVSWFSRLRGLSGDLEVTGSAEPEFAEASRARDSAFPIEWGAPIGRPFSQERTEWIRAREVAFRIDRTPAAGGPGPPPVAHVARRGTGPARGGAVTSSPELCG